MACLALLTAGRPVGLAAQACADYRQHPRWLATLAVPGTPAAADTCGHHVLVAAGSAGLQVVEVADPEAPVLVHAVALGDARAVKVFGNLAFVAAGAQGLAVLDISDPARAAVMATAPTEGAAVGVAVRDTIAIVAMGARGVKLFGIGDPAAPRPIRTIDTPGVAYAVDATAHCAYVADGPGGLSVIDLTGLPETRTLEVVRTSGDARDVAVHGGNLLAAVGDRGVLAMVRDHDLGSEAWWQLANEVDATGVHPLDLAGSARFDTVRVAGVPEIALITADSNAFAEARGPLPWLPAGRISFRFSLADSFAARGGVQGLLGFVGSDADGLHVGDFRLGLDPVDGRLVFAQEDTMPPGTRILRSAMARWDGGIWYTVVVDWNDQGRTMTVTWADSLGSHVESVRDGAVASCFAREGHPVRLGSRPASAPADTLHLDWLRIERATPKLRQASTTALAGYTRDIALRGNHAFAASEYGDLSIIEVSSVSAPRVVGTVDVDRHASGVAVTGGHAFVTDLVNGLQLVSCLQAESPPAFGPVATPGVPYGVVVAAGRALVADRQGGLRVLDVGDPVAPVARSAVATAGHALDVAVAGSHAFVAEAVFLDKEADSVLREDGADPMAVAAALFPVFEPSGGDPAKSTAFSGIEIFDLAVDGAPVLVGSVPTPGYAVDVEVVGDMAYVADFTSFLVIDASQRNAPGIVGSLDTGGMPRDLAVAGTMAYVADIEGLKIIDVSIPGAPELVGSLLTPGHAYGVAVRDDRAYVADVEAGLHIVDVSSPALPVLLATIATPGGAFRVEVAGDHAYVLDGFREDYLGMQIIDIVDPALAAVVGSIDCGREFHGVAIDGDHVYAVDSGSGLRVFPRQCGVITPPAPGLAVSDRDLRIRTEEGVDEVREGVTLFMGARVVNMGDRSASGRVRFEYEDPAGLPVEIGEVDVYLTRRGTAGGAVQVELPWVVRAVGTTIHVTIDDVVPPDGELRDNHARLVLTRDSLDGGATGFIARNEPAGVRLSWGANAPAGEIEFRLLAAASDTSWLVPFAREGAARYAAVDIGALALAGQVVTYTLYAREAGGSWSPSGRLDVAVTTLPSVTRLLGCHPNPFNPRVAVDYAVDHPQQVRIVVYDIRGRRVAILVDAWTAAGSHAVQWDGRDDVGRPLGSGEYLLQLTGESVAESRKVMLLR